MMKTQNYNLNKPEPTDPMRLADFNANSDIIDAALKNLSAEHVHVGTYTGDGADEQIISLPFTPRAVFLFVRFDVYTQTYIVTESFQFYFSSGGSNGFTTNANSGCTLLENGMKVSGITSNYKDAVSHYIAIG